MAGPFNIDVTSPVSSSNISAFPLNERNNRVVINNWLSFLSDPATGLIYDAALPASLPRTDTQNIWTTFQTFQDAGSGPLVVFKKTDTTVPNGLMYFGIKGVDGDTEIQVDAGVNQPNAVFAISFAGARKLSLSKLGALSLSTPLALTEGGVGATTASGARATLGLGDLSIENSPLALNKGGTGSTTAAGVRTALGLGNIALENGPLDLTKGGTGASTAAGARTNLALGNLAVLNRGDLVYSGTGLNNTDYPIGTTVIMTGVVSRNQVANVYVGSGNSTYQDTNAGNGVLTGTWNARGSISATSTLMQRTS